MNVLILFAKYPQAGKVKTRLGKEIGMETSAVLQKHILLDLVSLHKGKEYDFIVAHADNLDTSKMRYLVETDVVLQQGDNLGQKMHNMFDSMLEKYDKVVIIGSDTPGIDSEVLGKVFSLLDSVDVVLGPAHDGGYYLIGMKESFDIFSDIEWSTEHVLSSTLDKIRKLSISFELLEKRHDIDTLEDLKNYPKYKLFLESFQKR